MGASTSTLNKLVTEEFDRLSEGRPHIVLDEVLEFRLSSGGWVVSPNCIGLLYFLDKDRDGRFSLPELKEFVSDWNYLGQRIFQHELQGHMHSLCMGQFWKEILSETGFSQAKDWLVQLAANNYVPPKLLEPIEADTIPLVTPESAVTSILSAADQYDCPDCAPRQFDGFPGVTYVNQQNLLGLYKILAHKGKHRQELTYFNNVLQKFAEDQNMLPLDDPSMDDWVPAPIVDQYVGEVLKNCSKLLQEMGMEETVLNNTFKIKPDIPAGWQEDSPEPDARDVGDDSTELRPPAELSNYSDMSPRALQPPLSSSSSPEMQRQMSGSKVPPLRLGRASNPVPPLSAASSARKSPAAIQSPVSLRSPPARLDLKHAVSSGRIPPLQFGQPPPGAAAAARGGGSVKVPGLRLGGSSHQPSSNEIQPAAGISSRKPEGHNSAQPSTARSSADQGPSSNERAGSGGGRVPRLRLGSTTGAGGVMVPSLQLASASGGEPTLQRTSPQEHTPELHGQHGSDAVSPVRLSSPSGDRSGRSGSEPDLSHVEQMTQLPVPPMRVGKKTVAVPLLQLGGSKKIADSAPAMEAVPNIVESHPLLTNRSEGSASSHAVSARRPGSSAVIVKAAEGMEGAQARQPRDVGHAGGTDTIVASSSRVVPDEPTPRHQPPSSRVSSRVHSGRPPDKLSSRRTSEAAVALREGLSARHVFEEDASHRSSNQVAAFGQPLLSSRASMEYSSRPSSSRVSHTHTHAGNSSRAEGGEAARKQAASRPGSSRREERPHSSRQAEWQRTTRDYSQPGTVPEPEKQPKGREQAVSRANSAQLSSQGREAATQALGEAPRRGAGVARDRTERPQRGVSPALASPVQSSLSSPNVSARNPPMSDRQANIHLARAVADGRVQVERPKVDSALSHGHRIKLRGRPPEEASSSGPLSGPSSGGRSPVGREQDRRAQSSGRAKVNRSTPLVQTWRGARPGPERQGSGNSNSRRLDSQPGRGSPDRTGGRRSLDSPLSHGQGSPQGPGQSVRNLKAGNFKPVRGASERTALAERKQ